MPADWAESKRVEEQNRTCTHCKDIANDSAYSRCRPLERFDCAGMIVAFHLERHSPAIADVDHSSVFLSRLNQNLRIRRGKLLKFEPGVLVGAMFAPHNRKHPSSVKFGARFRALLMR